MIENNNMTPQQRQQALLASKVLAVNFNVFQALDKSYVIQVGSDIYTAKDDSELLEKVFGADSKFRVALVNKFKIAA